jgi:hypothetical protein
VKEKVQRWNLTVVFELLIWDVLVTSV